jgi:hypothetical protein
MSRKMICLVGTLTPIWLHPFDLGESVFSYARLVEEETKGVFDNVHVDLVETKPFNPSKGPEKEIHD